MPMAMMPISDTWRPMLSRLRTVRKAGVACQRNRHMSSKAMRTPVSRARSSRRTLSPDSHRRFVRPGLPGLAYVAPRSVCRSRLEHASPLFRSLPAPRRGICALCFGRRLDFTPPVRRSAGGSYRYRGPGRAAVRARRQASDVHRQHGSFHPPSQSPYRAGLPCPAYAANASARLVFLPMFLVSK